MKQRSNGNFFSLPNEIFLLGLRPGELAVYSYLRRCEDRGTHQCWPSYKTIGKAVGCLLYTSPSPRDGLLSRMPSSA